MDCKIWRANSNVEGRWSKLVAIVLCHIARIFSSVCIHALSHTNEISADL